MPCHKRIFQGRWKARTDLMLVRVGFFVFCFCNKGLICLKKTFRIVPGIPKMNEFSVKKNK